MYDLEKMKRLAAKGKVSRRDFVQFAMALGSVSWRPKPCSSRRSGPSRKRVVRQGSGSRTARRPIHSIRASTSTLSPSSHFGERYSNSLTVVDEFGKIQPDLAESYEASDGPRRQWVYRLRKGATFHNGKDVTPEDVVDSYRFHMTAEFQVGGEVGFGGGGRNQGRRTRHSHLHAFQRQCRFSLPDKRLPHPDNAFERRRDCGLAIRRTDRGLHFRRVSGGNQSQTEA